MGLIGSKLLSRQYPAGGGPTPPDKKYALDFNGTSDYVEIPLPVGSIITNPVTPMTVEFKVNLRGRQYILSSGAQAGSSTGFYITNGNGTSPQFGLRTTTEDYFCNFFIIGDYDVWLHLAMVCDGNELVMYVEGVEKGRVAKQAGSYAPAYNNLHIGNANNNNSLFVEGMSRDLRVWSVARSQADIIRDRDVMFNGNEPGLKYLWKFSEGSGTILGDSGPNNCPGTIYGATWVELEE